MNDPYDPQAHRTPPDAQASAPTPHSHQRHYDVGLVAPPVSLNRVGRVVVALLAASALAFFGAFLIIGQYSNKACQERSAISAVLINIIRDGDPDIDGYVKSGVITEDQGRRAHMRNAKAIKALQVDEC